MARPSTKKSCKAAIDTSSALTAKVMGVVRSNDMMLGWVEREYPQLASWRALAVEWMKGETSGIGNRLKALTAFLEKYLVRRGLPLDPAKFLARGALLPDFYQTACPNSRHGVSYNNVIHSFLNFVLLRDFSHAADDGHPVVSPAYRNPVALRSKSGAPRHDESVHSPLPYGYIDELRKMLAAGPNFGDWNWAHSAIGREVGKKGAPAPDWFPVSEAEIDRHDPDCVYRVRPRSKKYGGPVLEMWCPVRWVALLVKLLVPLRTFQVRMLDSGEADTWRYEKGNWVLNTNRLAEGSERRPLQQGVFRRANPLRDGEEVSTVIYINTNKTADLAKSGPNKGYVMAWPHQELIYWLEKLRSWQEKYNPIVRRTAWTELDGRHIEAKSDVQLSQYPDACFLFRLREVRALERHLPMSDVQLQYPWFALLEALELRLANRGETHSNGAPIRLVRSHEERYNRNQTLFPLHSLRVSLITALALEGQVPFPILQKLVGHSRLLMTLYYTKPGATHIKYVLDAAVERLDANKGASILNFLQDTEHARLLEDAICNSTTSLAAAIPQRPAARNPAGWMLMHDGVCLVGGNTSELEDNSSIGGCYNGGPNIGSNSNPKHGLVPGGCRHCVNCRWFMTDPEYLKALAATFNNTAYLFDEAARSCRIAQDVYQDLKNQKFDAEKVAQPFAKMAEYRQAERVLETDLKCFSDLAYELEACQDLALRCTKVDSSGDGMRLVAAGSAADVQLVFEEIDSELLQLSGVCANVEIYPDLDPGKAVFRRSQLLDIAFHRENRPPLFMLLSEHEQLLAGNAFMKRLAQQMNPDNPSLGNREVIRLIDRGESLSKYFGIDLATLTPASMTATSPPIAAVQFEGGRQ